MKVFKYLLPVLLLVTQAHAGAEGTGGGHTVVDEQGNLISLDDYQKDQMKEEEICPGAKKVDIFTDPNLSKVANKVYDYFDSLVGTRHYEGAFKSHKEKVDIGPRFQKRMKQLTWKYCASDLLVIYDMGLQSTINGKLVQSALQFDNDVVVLSKKHFGKNAKHDEAVLLHELLESFFGIKANREVMREISTMIRSGANDEDIVYRMKTLDSGILNSYSLLWVKPENYDWLSFNVGGTAIQIQQYLRNIHTGKLVDANTLNDNNLNYLSASKCNGYVSHLSRQGTPAYFESFMLATANCGENPKYQTVFSKKHYDQGYRLEKICLKSMDVTTQKKASPSGNLVVGIGNKVLGVYNLKNSKQLDKEEYRVQLDGCFYVY